VRPDCPGRPAGAPGRARALLDSFAQARWQYSGWGQRTIAYLDRLQAAGYTPTPWETARLNSARATAEAPVDQTEYPTDPSRYELSHNCLDGWIILPRLEPFSGKKRRGGAW
jgi:hypothetical protein